MQQFKNIQALRAVAALLVLTIHTFSDRSGLGPDTDWLRGKFWWIGPAGVDLFFVISGFIITITAARAAARSEPRHRIAFAFAIRRALRIFPVYWLVFAASTMCLPWFRTSTGIPNTGFVKKFFLMTVWNDRVASSWSLSYELFFYASLAAILLLFPARHIFRALGIWCAIFLAIVSTTYFTYPESTWTVARSPLLIEFMLGCAVAYLYQTGVRQYGLPALLIGLVWFFVSVQANSLLGKEIWDPRWRTPLFGIASALIVYGLVAIEATRSVRVPKALTAVGDASYSIYIWHQFIVAFGLFIADRLQLFAVFPASVVVLTWSAGCIAIGFASYRYVERPIMNFANKVTNDKRWPVSFSFTKQPSSGM